MSNISVTTTQSVIAVTDTSGITVTTPTGQTIDVTVPNSSVNVTNTTDDIIVLTNGTVIQQSGITSVNGDTGPVVVLDTDDISQGTTNKYFSQALARQSLSAGTGISYDSNTGVITSIATGNITSVNGQTGPTVVLDTDDISEGTNKYFSQSLARASLSAGTGISYDSGTGVITNTSTGTTYTQNISAISGGANLNLVGSDSTTDTVKFADGTGVTVSYTDANTATIAIGQDVATSAHPTFAGLTSTRTTASGGKVVDSNGDVLVLKTGINTTQQPVAAFFDNTTANRRGVIVAREYGQNTGNSATAATVGAGGLILEGSRGTAASPVTIGSNNNTIGNVSAGTYDGSRWSSENTIGFPATLFFQNTEVPAFETSSFTADIATNGVMTVSAVASGSIHPGQVLTGGSLPIGVLVTAYGNNTFGGTGTYNLNYAPATALTGLSLTGTGTTRSGARFGIVQQPSGNKLTGATRQTIMIAAQTGTSTETINGVTIGNNTNTNFIYGNVDGNANIQLPSSDGTRVYQARGKQNFQVNGGNIFHFGVTQEDLAQFQGYISGNTLTVTSVSSGTISQGALVNATGIAQGTFISNSYGTGGTTGTGQTGTYTITSTFATAGQTIGSSGSPVAMVTTADNNAQRGSNYWNTITARKSSIGGRYAPLKNGDGLLQITVSGANGASVGGNTTTVGSLGWFAKQDFTSSQAGTSLEIKTADVNTTNNNVRLRLASDRNDYYSNEHYFYNATGSGNAVYINSTGNLGVQGGQLDLFGSTNGRVSFQAQATGTSQTYTLPNADGSNNQVLTTNGSGQLSWTSVGGGGNPFDQDLNTFDTPSFEGLTINGPFGNSNPFQYIANLDSASPYGGASFSAQTNYSATSGGARVVPQANWALGNFRFESYDTTGGNYVLANQVASQSTENWSNGVNGSRMIFQTTPQGEPWTNSINSLFLQPEQNRYQAEQHSFRRLDGQSVVDITNNGSFVLNDPDAPVSGNSFSITPYSAFGRQTVSLNSASTDGSAFSTLNFGNFRYNGTNFSPTQFGDVLGEYKFNGNSNSGGTAGVPGGPGGNITVNATENWSNTANGTQMNFFAIKAGTLDTYAVFSANPVGSSFTSDSFTFQTAVASPVTLATVNSSAATFTVPVTTEITSATVLEGTTYTPAATVDNNISVQLNANGGGTTVFDLASLTGNSRGASYNILVYNNTGSGAPIQVKNTRINSNNLMTHTITTGSPRIIINAYVVGNYATADHLVVA